jgi:hypothetical protein
MTLAKHVFTGVNDTGNACITVDAPVGPLADRLPLKEQSVKKQAISRYYFSTASNQSSKESSNNNKIVCFAGVNDTGEAPEKLNISANIRKKSKSLLSLSTGARRICLKKKTRGEKSGGTVPLIRLTNNHRTDFTI